MSALPNIKKIIKTAIIARSGIYQYKQNELSMFGLKPEDAPVIKEIYNVYRPSVVLVENKEKFSMMPLTNEHPNEFLTNENWKEFIAGYTGENIKDEHNNEIDEITLKTSIAVIDEDAINDLISGKKEVSCGYYGMFKFENGISPKGEPYDIIMFGVDEEANHLALCQRARGGETIKIIDSKGGYKKMGKFVSGLWHSAKKLILGVKDADLGQFRAIVGDIVKNKTSLSDEEITKKVQSLQNMISDLPESEEKAKLSRFIEDFPKGIKEKDEATAQKAGELITSLFEKLDTESMENVPETSTETDTTDQDETTQETSEETNDQGTETETETETETTTETEDQNETQETQSTTTTEETKDSKITPEQMKYISEEVMTLLKNTLTEDCFKKTADSEESEDKDESGTQNEEEENETTGAKDSMHNVDISSTNKSDPVEEWYKRKTGGK